MALAMRMVRNVEEQRRKRKDAPPHSPHSASEGLFRYPGTAVDQFGASAARATFSPERGPTSRGMFFSAPGPKAHGMLSLARGLKVCGMSFLAPGPQAFGVFSLARGSKACNAVCSPHARGQKECMCFSGAWPAGV